MLNTDFVYNAYDFALEDGRICILLYELTEDSKRVNGKNKTIRHTNLVKKIYPDNAELYVKFLKDSNYIYLGKNNQMFNCDSLDPLINAKILLLSLDHKALERVYDENAIVNNENVIKRYLHYINVNTGIEKVMYLGYERNNKENIAILKLLGYVPMTESPLLNATVPNKISRVRRK